MLTALRDSYFLMQRAIREALRQPGVEAGNIFIPLFFFAVTVGAIGSVAAEAFGVEDFTAFQMPVAVLQAVASASSGAGFGLITDIQSGYFDKLLLTPANRGAVVLGRMLADCVRAMFLTVVIIVVALLFGSRMDTGLPGAIVLVLMAGLFGLAYSGLNASLALRTAVRRRRR